MVPARFHLDTAALRARRREVTVALAVTIGSAVTCRSTGAPGLGGHSFGGLEPRRDLTCPEIWWYERGPGIDSAAAASGRRGAEVGAADRAAPWASAVLTCQSCELSPTCSTRRQDEVPVHASASGRAQKELVGGKGAQVPILVVGCMFHGDGEEIDRGVALKGAPRAIQGASVSCLEIPGLEPTWNQDPGRALA